MAQWIEHWTTNQTVAVQLQVRAHVWVVGQVPSGGCERQPHIDISLPFSFPSPLSKNKQMKSFKKKKRKESCLLKLIPLPLKVDGLDGEWMTALCFVAS